MHMLGRIALIVACSLLAACAKDAPSGPREKGMPAQHAVGRTIGSYTYTDAPAEARLGPHVFMFPANYYRDQMGPSFDASFSLLVQWPDLQPLPPGERSRQDMATFDRQITIAPRYVDRVPIETRLEASTRPIADPGTLEADDPATRLDLMRVLPEQNGLTPYVVDTARLDAYARRYEAEMGISRVRKRDSYQDWFARRDAKSKMMTLIHCDLEPESGDDRRPQCTHEIVIPELLIAVSMDYPREFLPGWRRIEDRARALIAQYRVE